MLSAQYRSLKRPNTYCAGGHAQCRVGHGGDWLVLGLTSAAGRVAGLAPRAVMIGIVLGLGMNFSCWASWKLNQEGVSHNLNGCRNTCGTSPMPGYQ